MPERLYPFMPRIGDRVKDQSKEGIVSDRHINKENDTKFLKVKFESINDDTFWETSFELPL